MDRELDPLDVRLLKSLAVQGEMSPKDIDDRRRLDRLEVEGYVASVRNDPPGLNASPAWIYRLTRKGRSAGNW